MRTPNFTKQNATYYETYEPDEELTPDEEEELRELKELSKYEPDEELTPEEEEERRELRELSKEALSEEFSQDEIYDYDDDEKTGLSEELIHEEEEDLHQDPFTTEWSMRCPECGGSGYNHIDGGQCERCQGDGELDTNDNEVRAFTKDQNLINSQEEAEKEEALNQALYRDPSTGKWSVFCPECDGSGYNYLEHTECERCQGDGELDAQDAQIRELIENKCFIATQDKEIAHSDKT